MSESSVFHGDECTVTVNLRPIIWRAFEVDATKFLIAHAHPSGDNSPSRSDLAVTRMMAWLAGHLGIQLMDHLIYGAADWFSFRRAGLL